MEIAAQIGRTRDRLASVQRAVGAHDSMPRGVLVARRPLAALAAELREIADALELMGEA